MARSASDEEIRLRKRARRRLIGAIALTTVVVVVLPMVLDSEPRPAGDDISVQIPSPDSGPYAPKSPVEPSSRPGATALPAGKADGPGAPGPSTSAGPAPAGMPARATAAVPATIAPSATPADRSIELAGAPRPAPAVPAAAEAKQAGAPKPAAAREAETKAARTAAPEAMASAPRGADTKDAEAKTFVIQLGAFSEATRARDRHAQLVKAGIRAYTEVIKTPTGDKTRVRAGPFPTRQAAEQANEQVKALGITEGVVVPRRY